VNRVVNVIVHNCLDSGSAEKPYLEHEKAHSYRTFGVLPSGQSLGILNIPKLGRVTYHVRVRLVW
jgi:hypothetical protein